MSDYLSLFHWSFLAVTLGIAVLTDLVKRILKILPKKKWFELVYDGRVLPAVLGFGAGFIPGIPLPSIVSHGIGSALYFMTAGILSAWVYSLLEKVFKDYLPENIKNWISEKFSGNKNKEE